jgi:hypothetical protein
MCDLGADAKMVFRVLSREEAILLRKVADFCGPKIFLSGAGVKPRAERYNRR